MEPLPFGFTVELLDIPLRTETIELCNTFDLNPYELLSGKCMALICRRPQQTLRRLQEAGCIAANVMADLDILYMTRVQREMKNG